jgi:hypothetical protein
MSTSGVPVKLLPRAVPCHATTVWDSEAALLVCSFAYEAGPQAPLNIAQRTDAALGISSAPPRALLGEVEFTRHDESRLQSIELRTGRNQWEASSLRAPSERVQEAAMTLALEYDFIASVDLDVWVLRDERMARLGLRFGDVELENGRWVAIADNVFVCVDDEQRLIEVRFAHVESVTDDAS